LQKEERTENKKKPKNRLDKRETKQIVNVNDVLCSNFKVISGLIYNQSIK